MQAEYESLMVGLQRDFEVLGRDIAVVDAAIQDQQERRTILVQRQHEVRGQIRLLEHLMQRLKDLEAQAKKEEVPS